MQSDERKEREWKQRGLLGKGTDILKEVVRQTGTFIHTLPWRSIVGAKGKEQKIIIESNDERAVLKAVELLERKKQMV